ncbi:UDP-glucuronosyltransferase 2B1-like [Contarinia nasturtii]|uniref:UDP-glucuronosyltransferase 2B1-like n=1 Tax=Contarinia nasturtii TaxID=265458 RepID=UPI0012D40064|nr:UDP-glucuronosyltransferase 2B1-like [Contarinia nasturtii]
MNFQFLLAFSIFLSFANGYKILFLAPMNGKSHFLYISSFVKALIGRGHEVTFLTSNSLRNLNLPNYTEVLVDPPLEMSAMVKQDDFVDMASASIFSCVHLLRDMPRIFNPYTLQNANIQKFIHSTGLHFDLVINEEFYGDSMLMFAHKFKAPIITICPFGVPEYIDRQQGLLTPISFVPHWMLPFSDNMTFYERFLNLILNAYDWAVRRYQFIPTEEEYVQKYFAHLAPLPSIDELHKNVSLVLVNSHRALSPPRPSMPSIISIGGAHIKPAEPLPKEIQTFIDGAKHGVIYFSLGTVLKSSKLPKEKLDAFLGTFKSLKQRVLWKFEDDSIKNVPSNVMIKKWMPQNDILAHPKVILFISHGGLFGTSESLYHGVPLLLIPFFGDQHRNAHRIQTAGYGQFMPFPEVNKDSFSKTINELLSDESYLTKAKETSAIFKDNLVNPMDEAMFWIEHVCRFKGAKHLKSHAINMSWFTYLSLDIILANVVILLAGVLVLYKIICALVSRKKQTTAPGKKQK